MRGRVIRDDGSRAQRAVANARAARHRPTTMQGDRQRWREVGMEIRGMAGTVLSRVSRRVNCSTESTPFTPKLRTNLAIQRWSVERRVRRARVGRMVVSYEAGVALRRCSSFSHCQSTGSRSKAMVNATWRDTCASRMALRGAGESRRQALIFSCQVMR